VLVGGTSSTGGSRPGVGAVPPLWFLRQLACVDENLQPLSTAGCANFQTLPGDGWAHHPYSLRVLPWEPSVATKPDDAMMGDLPKLVQLLESLAAAGRIDARLKNIYLTEYGYETNDPVWNKPWSVQEQTTLLAQAEFLAWLLPTVRSYAQFLLSDINTQGAMDFLAQGRTGRAPGSWQSGLYWEPGFYNGAPKPAAETFRLTFLPMSVDGSSALKLWGHVRPASGATNAVIHQSHDGGATWTVLPTRAAESDGASATSFRTDVGGYFLRYADAPSTGLYRLVWTAPDPDVVGPPRAVEPERLFLV
jgi:hypothetical protein